MIKTIIEKVIGTYSYRELKRLYPIADEIDDFTGDMKRLSDERLRGKTGEFRERIAQGQSLDDILPEAFAVVREASRRVNGQTPFRVQCIGAIVLHQGRIAELKTGEGKTLMATMPAYLNALEGKGVHIVTVNDYLAKRDSEWMGKIYNFLGLSVGLIVHDLDNASRKAAYACDITYGTNNEIGFDYLRDNMVTYKADMVQRGLAYAIVDEVDSILIDEARTPLIISGHGDKSTDLYKKADTFAKRLKALVIAENDDKKSQEDIEEEYVVDEKAHTATLTERGVRKAESYFGVSNLTDIENVTLLHHINQAIKANGLMKLDREYVINDGQIIIVDEFTGRLMYGRRYSEGLHQAIEAKEGVKVEHENKTLATITFQNLFRLYGKLAGMTGTALTEEQEFQEIYKLDVIEIPTNLPMIRSDLPDCVLKTEEGKFKVVIEEIARCNESGQPVLIGTISIEKSELLSTMLRRRGIRHEVLNAKHHEREAEIIAQAGKYKAVTIATNMAGRGTDIVLGGNPEFLAKQDMRKSGFDEELIAASNSFNETEDENILKARNIFSELYRKHKLKTDEEHDLVVEAGGLCILGTERHESRRIDNQLRGRSGRQGDPGLSKFFISLEDDLMRLFGSERLGGIVTALGLRDDEPIEHNMLSNAVETAQRRVEGRNFSIRKHVLQYDDVMNQQRSVIYAERIKVLNGEILRDSYIKMAEDVIGNIVSSHTANSQYMDDWDFDGMNSQAASLRLPAGLFEVEQSEREDVTADSLKLKALDKIESLYEQKEQELTSEALREIERVVLLRVVDEKWMDHIDAMDELRHGISMRAYAQRDPIVEYKFEGFEMFEQMTRSISEESLSLVLRAKLHNDQNAKRKSQRANAATTNGAGDGDGAEDASQSEDAEDNGRAQPAPLYRNGLTGGRRGAAGMGASGGGAPAPAKRAIKVGRNDPCPCGSGKKFKNCCGNIA